jgi:hypothetical protein
MPNKRRTSKVRLMAVPTPAPTVGLRGPTSNGSRGRNSPLMSFHMLDHSAQPSADPQMGAEDTYPRERPKYPPADALVSPLTRVIEAVIVWLTAAIAVAFLLGPLTNP